MIKRLLAFLFLTKIACVLGQERKQIIINKTSEIMIIDGVLDEDSWKQSVEMKDFVMFRPDVNLKEPKGKSTIVKTVYTNESIYFGAILYDDDIDGIPKQVMNRDEFGNTDFFGVILNPSNDQQNDFEFFVQYTGSQCDAFSNPSSGEDFSWNAVWESKITYHKTHWIVEMKIPYSALRFSNAKIQDWGINIHRNYRNTRAQYTWNFIDRTKGNISQYHGQLLGLKDLKPPVRLSLFPYLSSYYSTNTKDKFSTKLGVDFKYGLTENFTLDATLIPDFGQTGFDNEALNLGPFEQRFDEQRQFFTENIELFNKGDLFYSRRVGGQPIDYNSIELNDGDSILSNPSTVETLNALKISGRTKKGLGIGFFNAITDKTEAEIIQNDVNGTKRKVTTNPYSLYNVLVLEQQFKRNSTVSFINTSVLRNGQFKDANVSSLRFKYFTEGNRYSWSGFSNLSHISSDKSSNGFAGDINFSKASGNFRYLIGANIYSDKYDVNDVGIYFGNNTQKFYGELELYEFKPKKKRLNSRLALVSEINYLFNPRTYTGNEIALEGHLNTLKFLTIGGEIRTKLGNQFDYFEARTTGKYFKTKSEFSANVFLSSDYRKTFALDFRLNAGNQLANERDPFFIQTVISPRFNVNDHLTIVLRTELFKNIEDVGFVDKLDTQIVFGKRNRFTIQNTIKGNYRFSAKTGVELSFRNYWSSVEYDRFYSLKNNGELSVFDYDLESYDPNKNFMTWNMDISYNWNFAPGSELIFLYRNQLKQVGTNSNDDYFSSVDELLTNELNHTLSLRLVYYLDYHTIKSKWINS